MNGYNIESKSSNDAAFTHFRLLQIFWYLSLLLQVRSVKHYICHSGGRIESFILIPGLDISRKTCAMYLSDCNWVQTDAFYELLDIM